MPIWTENAPHSRKKARQIIERMGERKEYQRTYT